MRQLAVRASSSGKYFWLAFIVRMRHSCGTSRNSRSKLAEQHVRALDQRGHLVQQRGVVDRRQRRRSAFAAACSWRAMSVRRCLEAGDDGAFSRSCCA